MKRKLLLSTIIIICAVVMIVFEVVKPTIFNDESINQLFTDTIIRFFGFIIFLTFVIVWYPRIIKIKKDDLKLIPIVIPCYIVAINNLPIVSLINGTSVIDGKASIIIMLFIRCISVALFEEFAFRGVIQSIVIERFHSTKKHIILSVIISSAFFGLVHIVNLAFGSGIVPVLMQIGYSFLIGGLCGYVLIETHSVWNAVLIHAIFDFCGEIVSYAGHGEMVNIPQIILTSSVAIIVLVYILIRIKKSDLRKDISIIYET